MREITIYATRGGQTEKINTAATTWGELQPLVREKGFDLSSLMAAENINKTDLVNDLAVLPEGNFRLFLRPKQTKSGADRKELFEIIKNFVNQHPEKKASFIIEGKNMTQLPTSILESLCQSIIEDVQNQVNARTTVASSDVSDSELVLEARNAISPLYHYDGFNKADKALKKLGKEVKTSSEPQENDLEREARELGYL